MWSITQRDERFVKRHARYAVTSVYPTTNTTTTATTTTTNTNTNTLISPTIPSSTLLASHIWKEGNIDTAHRKMKILQPNRMRMKDTPTSSIYKHPKTHTEHKTPTPTPMATPKTHTTHTTHTKHTQNTPTNTTTTTTTPHTVAPSILVLSILDIGHLRTHLASSAFLCARITS